MLETNMTPEQVAARGYAMAKVSGHGLFYGENNPNGKGRRIFTEAQWDADCAQAKAWGISVVHPKVAEGTLWYGNKGNALDLDWLHMLKSVADKHGLLCYPYHYVYGGTLGDNVGTEAAIGVTIGQIFGGYCPDMEIEWERNSNSPTWARDFGSILRQHFKGPILPNLFAVTQKHQGFPYLEVLNWSSGWMPMVYFDEWTDAAGKQMTAQETVYAMYADWVVLNKSLTAHGVFPPPILPIIELGNHLPAAEVTSWLKQMKNYGYTAYWYDLTFPPYAETIKLAPAPAWKITSSIPSNPTPVSAPTKPEPTGSVGTSTGGSMTQTPGTNASGVDQHLTADELFVCWQMVDPTIPYNPDFGIPKLFARLMNGMYPIGAATSREDTITVNGKKYTVQNFEGGRAFYNQETGHVWFQPTGASRVPGNSTTLTPANP